MNNPLPRPWRRRTPRTVLMTALMLGLFVGGGAGQAAAVDNGALGIRPANESDFFHLSLHPGAAMDATAVVSNHTDSPVTLLSYPVDATSTPQGAFALANQGEPREGVGGWVQLNAEEITVAPNSDLEVPLRISVPAGTPPGDYAGGLIIQSPPVQGQTTNVNGDTAVRLDVIQRQGVRIYLNVAGTAVKTLSHGDLSWQQAGDTLTFILPLKNTGNTILHPSATVDVSSWLGANTQLTFDTPESMLPGSSLDLQSRLTHAPSVQSGTARATVSSEAGTAYAETSVAYAPWPLLVGCLLVLLSVIYAAWRISRFVRRARRAIAQVAEIERPTRVPDTRLLQARGSQLTPRGSDGEAPRR